ncbi:MAG: lyase family protein, partial [Deltaproteobacteria bacterium]
VIEIISALSLAATHLSRFAEDMVLWASKEFSFVDIDDAYCTGSSLMPQKKNPDVLELVRGYAGRLYGSLVSVLTMMKGLPLSYNRDMQLDKEPLFDSIETVSIELEVLAGLVKTLKFNALKIGEYLCDESLYATDLVYYLVSKGVPFKDAHTAVGGLVRESLDRGIPIKEMPEAAIRKFSDKFSKKEIVRMFDPAVSVRSRRSVRR